jgi:cell division protein FtsB
MGLIAEFRARARHVIGPVLGFCAAGYFAYHVVHGDRGLIAWIDLQRKVEAMRAALARIEAERQTLENRVQLLHPQSLDPDLLEERARVMLNYGYPDDIVILDPRKRAGGHEPERGGGQNDQPR